MLGMVSAVDITTCQSLLSDTTYDLTADINTELETCFTTGSNVIFNGNGHSITKTTPVYNHEAFNMPSNIVTINNVIINGYGLIGDGDYIVLNDIIFNEPTDIDLKDSDYSSYDNVTINNWPGGNAAYLVGDYSIINDFHMFNSSRGSVSLNQYSNVTNSEFNNVNGMFKPLGNNFIDNNIFINCSGSSAGFLSGSDVENITISNNVYCIIVAIMITN